LGETTKKDRQKFLGDELIEIFLICGQSKNLVGPGIQDPLHVTDRKLNITLSFRFHTYEKRIKSV